MSYDINFALKRYHRQSVKNCYTYIWGVICRLMARDLAPRKMTNAKNDFDFVSWQMERRKNDISYCSIVINHFIFMYASHHCTGSLDHNQLQSSFPTGSLKHVQKSWHVLPCS